MKKITLERGLIFIMKKIFIISVLALWSIPSYSMHIMEGFLPVKHAVFWWALIIPFIAFGTKKIKKLSEKSVEVKMIFALAAAFVFVLSALKLPSVTGSSSHPTGIGLGAILFGPEPMFVIGFVVLIFQALFLAHGGLTTLGANTFSMGIAGSLVSYMIYKLSIKKINKRYAVFFAAAIGNLTTYCITAIQIAAAHSNGENGFIMTVLKFLGIFALTQIPLAVIEGIVSVLVLNLIPAEVLNDEKKI